MDNQAPPFCFTEEELDAQRGEVMSQGHTALTLGDLLTLSGRCFPYV